MKLLKTIRADPSDTFVFDRAAQPGEWAISGALMFAHLDPAGLRGKARAAFRAGFLGIDSLGWSTLARIVEASEEERTAAIELLARRFVERFGAPDLMTARPIAVSRRQENDVTRESFRTLQANAWSKPSRVFSFEAEDDEAAPAGQIDLAALIDGERR